MLKKTWLLKIAKILVNNTAVHPTTHDKTADTLKSWKPQL